MASGIRSALSASALTCMSDGDVGEVSPGGRAFACTRWRSSPWPRRRRLLGDRRRPAEGAAVPGCSISAMHASCTARRSRESAGSESFWRSPSHRSSCSCCLAAASSPVAAEGCWWCLPAGWRSIWRGLVRRPAAAPCPLEVSRPDSDRGARLRGGCPHDDIVVAVHWRHRAGSGRGAGVHRPLVRRHHERLRASSTAWTDSRPAPRCSRSRRCSWWRSPTAASAPPW